MFTHLILIRHDLRLEGDLPITKGWDVRCMRGYVNHGTLANIPIKDMLDLLGRFPEAVICTPDPHAYEWLRRKNVPNLKLGK